MIPPQLMLRFVLRASHYLNAKLIDSMDSKNRKLKSELRKRDAISDTIGGHVYLFSMGEMWVTEPDGCYLGMRNLQN